MLLGKRHRPPNNTIRRTTSMSGITVDVSSELDPPADDLDATQIIEDLHASVGPEPGLTSVVVNHVVDNDNSNHLGRFGNKNNFDYLYENRFLNSMVSPRYNSKIGSSCSVGVVDTAHFLRTCGLCNRRLAPGKDIYMYRGDTAFCSLECREQQIKQDEKKEKSSSVRAPT